VKTSENSLKIKKYFESCSLIAYPDPGSKDGHPWTIGWGHTGAEVKEGLVWTQAKADATLLVDAGDAERSVNSLTKVILSQNQFDALVSFVFNIGHGQFRDSTLLRYLNAGHYEGASDQLLRWNKNNGKTMLGLARRRLAEKYLFDGYHADYALHKAKNLN
jgi:lysozyme